jgi:hypothetical protein
MAQCGHVYFLYLSVAGKDKLVVPAFVDSASGRVRFFVINSDRTEFQKTKPEVAKHVLPLPLKGHESFLNKDSWLACHELFGGWTVAEIAAHKGCYRAPLSVAVVTAVKAVIAGSRLHPDPDKADILAQWP